MNLPALIGKLRSLFTGRPALHEIIVHDPAAQEPHDLDDPFFDQEVQQRVASVIAKGAKPPTRD